MDERQRKARQKGDTYAAYSPADTNTDEYSQDEIAGLSAKIRAASGGKVGAMSAHIKACRMLHATSPADLE